MPQSFTNLLYHMIWGTKDRYPWLTEEIRPRVHAYIGGIIRNLNSTAIEINGFNEHVHALVKLHPTVAVAEAARVVKANSTNWIHETFPALSDFWWQPGYTAFTVSESVVEKVREYIRRQPEHHRAMSYQDEMRELLRRHGLNPDDWTGE